MPTHHTVHVIAHRIQTGYRPRLAVEYPPRHPYPGRRRCPGCLAAVSRRRTAHAAVVAARDWGLQRFTLGLVVGRYAPLENRVLTLGGMAVEAVYRALQLLGVDPTVLCQLRQCAATVQVTAALIMAGGEGKGLGPANAIAALRGMIADQPGLHWLTRGVAANRAFMKSW